MEEPEVLLQVLTPLGFTVRSTRSYWDLIQTKHPEVRNRLAEVRQCLEAPEQVRRSRQDGAVHLFYRPAPPYHLCVVVKRLNGGAFMITCYLTDALKEGVRIWPAST